MPIRNSSGMVFTKGYRGVRRAEVSSGRVTETRCLTSGPFGNHPENLHQAIFVRVLVCLDALERGEQALRFCRLALLLQEQAKLIEGRGILGFDPQRRLPFTRGGVRVSRRQLELSEKSMRSRVPSIEVDRLA